jgi:hypothetical protein
VNQQKEVLYVTEIRNSNEKERHVSVCGNEGNTITSTRNIQQPRIVIDALTLGWRVESNSILMKADKRERKIYSI